MGAYFMESEQIHYRNPKPALKSYDTVKKILDKLAEQGGDLPHIIQSIGDLLTPVGTIVPWLGGSIAGQPIEPPATWVLADGAQYGEEELPELYAVLGHTYDVEPLSGMFYVPDLRECVLVGAGMNSNLEIEEHDIYDIGTFRDDQMQDFIESAKWRSFTPSDAIGWEFLTQSPTGRRVEGRYGATTHGKQFGIAWIIKAYSLDGYVNPQ